VGAVVALSTRTRWILGIAAIVLFGTVTFYFVPGLPDSPQGAHTHDLSRALLEAIGVAVICGLMIRFVILRDWFG
jgi:hypothetical protein